MKPFLKMNLRLWLLERLRPGELQKTLWTAAAIGLGGALATIGFRSAVALIEQLLFGQSQGLVRAAAALPWWLRLLIPASGGLVAGFILQWTMRYKREEVASDYMEAISLTDGALGSRLSLGRAASSLISIATGSSIGREGSMVQLSALIGAWLGTWRQLSAPKRRLLVACGGAAGITAAYNAPIAGALFIAEIVLRSIAIESLGPLIVASVVSNLTVHTLLGFKPVYQMPAFHLIYDGEVALHSLLGITAGLCAPWLLRLFDFSRATFQRLPWTLPFRLALGGAIVGLISIVRPEVWGNGYSVVNGILAGQWLWEGLLLVLVCKVMATAATTGSGAIGGIFTPTLFIGAAQGFLFGVGAHAIWPNLAPSPVYAATGMAAFLSATTYAPLTAILMIFEMTGNYQIMLPIMIASVLAYFVARLQRRDSVYARSLKPETRMDFGSMQVIELMRTEPPTVLIGAALSELERAYVISRWQHVYIVDDEGHFLGAASLHDVGPLLRAGSDLAAPLPTSLLRRDYPRVQPDANLGEALVVFAGHAGERIPVVSSADLLLGYVSKTDLMLLFQQGLGGVTN